MGVPLTHYSVFIRNIKDKKKIMLNQYKWCQIMKSNGAKDKTTNEFFKLCVKKGVFERFESTNLYRLTKKYEDAIMEIFCDYKCFDGSSFVDNIENYVDIVVD